MNGSGMADFSYFCNVMKIFTSSQIHELDQYTIEHEPVRSIDLMERAARALTAAIVDEWTKTTPVIVFAGPGNNGGDALAVARMLAGHNFIVKVYLFNIHNKLSADCAENKKRLEDDARVEMIEVVTDFDPPKLTADTLIVDGLFGSGLNKPLAGGFASLVRYINASPSKVVSIDLPSGLMAEDNTGINPMDVVQADLTLTLQQKKLSMLFADTQRFIGRLKILDIRLSQEYVRQTDSQFVVVDEANIRSLLLHRHEFAHKGTMGHALLVAGSRGMAGAAMLASRACLRSGAGKLTVHTPECNYNVMQLGVPEAVLHLDDDHDMFSVPVEAAGYDALGIGPGLGTNETSALALAEQLRMAKCPVVADADALNILGNHGAWLNHLPAGIIMTPHPREFDRLCGSICSSDYDRLDKAIDMAQQLDAYIVLKGHYSALCTPQGRVYFNSTGNAGMATAGSGDVLTGVLTSLLARGYQRGEACLVAMYVHGLAGDIAAREKGMESLVASDIIACLPAAFKQLYE